MTSDARPSDPLHLCHPSNAGRCTPERLYSPSANLRVLCLVHYRHVHTGPTPRQHARWRELSNPDDDFSSNRGSGLQPRQSSPARFFHSSTDGYCNRLGRLISDRCSPLATSLPYNRVQVHLLHSTVSFQQFAHSCTTFFCICGTRPELLPLFSSRCALCTEKHPGGEGGIPQLWLTNRPLPLGLYLRLCSSY